MTDWLSASAMLLAGLVVGVMFLYGMRRRRQMSGSDRLDLEAKRDALLAQLRSVDNSPEERARLEADTAAVLRKLDGVAAASSSSASAAHASATAGPQGDRAALKGFAWGAVSMAILAGIAWFVVQSAKPKSGPNQNETNAAQAAAAVPDAALTSLEKQVQASPDDLALRDELARAYLERENLNAVSEQTAYVLKRSPDDARALTYQALVHLAARQPDAAAAMLKRATKSDPKLLDAWVGLAWLYAQTGDLKNAEASLTEAKRQHPEESARLDELMAHLRNPQKPIPSTAEPNAAAPAAGAPQVDPAPAMPATPAAPGEAVRITLEDARPMPQYPPNAVIYIIARDEASSGGPPSAVKRMPIGTFPMKIELTAADSMMGQPLPQKMTIEARIDMDGDPMTHGPKDPSAAIDAVALGKSIKLTLK